ncbi:hypothetical protein Poli38472_003730 [Pythium oligandrum]|uniref:Uncharacterized protein n=1 Tax=Pythium oligandrum TaxID=41045 RepID=A0A8K1CME1_PYTOL|nr:hypothetical protein Poli38472_003730 [Pythium oligandrum]|eukprot:TMW65965.1 hypothetical protein Poli38472_003730 [Pythium oligandrum]
MVASEEPVVVTATPPPPAAKKFYGLGNYLPKVPSYSFLPKKDAASTDKAGDESHPTDGSEEDPADEAKSLPDIKDAAPLPPPRRRGLSLEQNAFASSLVRRFSTFRQSSTSSATAHESPTSEEGNVSSTSNPLSPRSEPGHKARRGACVSTKFGTGTVLAIRDDNFYIVQLVPNYTAYMREDMIIREIKSVVGERVKTRWGLATVEQYYPEEDMYSIALDWRWDDDHVWRMKATTKKFEKISKGMWIMQSTKKTLFEGYSTIRDSASTGYASVAANVAAKINTTTTAYNSYNKTRSAPKGDLGKALTPFGIVTVVEVRPDRYFVVKTKDGATGYFHADSVKLLNRRTNYSIGERVKTPYGAGEVVAYRDEDEMYEVKLTEFSVTAGSLPPTLYISDINAESMMTSLNAGQAYARISSLLNITRNSVYSASATMKASASGGLNSLTTVKTKVTNMAAIKMTKLKYQKGERVITPFGSGFISEARAVDRIYEVQLRRLKFHGFFHESALAPFPYERVTHFIVDGKTIPAPEMPKNIPEHRRRTIITAAIRQAREGK